MGTILADDITELRKSIRIGDMLTETVMTDKLGQKLARPKKIKHRVIARYPYVVEVENPMGLPRKTFTYADISKMKRGKTNV